jgi:hypothetical protein
MGAVKCGNHRIIPNKESGPIHRPGFIYMSLANHKPTEKKFVIIFHISLCDVNGDHQDHAVCGGRKLKHAVPT